ncbi:hypothetical protein BDV93DRAFT_561607 [Ceratobasidium sp. AG-I]|nr:hypothetical protein BDV93DRAFT_561607 [Ceratobasidium sp. AG-I]
MPHLSPRSRRTTVDAQASARLSSSHLGPVFGTTKGGRRSKGEDDNITRLGSRDAFCATGLSRVRIQATQLPSEPPMVTLPQYWQIKEWPVLSGPTKLEAPGSFRSSPSIATEERASALPMAFREPPQERLNFLACETARLSRSVLLILSQGRFRIVACVRAESHGVVTLTSVSVHDLAVGD